MNIEFRTRIGEKIDYNEIINYGLCCQGITSIGSTGEFDYYSCYATGGIFIPYTGNPLLVASQATNCPNPFI